MLGIPEVSVVIPLFNKGPYIARALNSVLAQTFTDFEVILVDDGSTDDGVEIIKGFNDPRIHLFQQENQGVSAARNRGIKEAQSDLVAFLDADDEWSSAHLDIIIKLRTLFPEAGLFTTAYIDKGPSRRTSVAKFYGIPEQPWEGLIKNYFKSAAFGFSPIISSTAGIPKKILLEIGGFNNNERFTEDLDLWAKIAIKYPIAFSWEGMAIYHHDATYHASERNEPIIEEFIISKTLKKILESNQLSYEIRDDIVEYLATTEILRALINYQIGCADLARKILKDCFTRKQKFKKYCVYFLTYMPRIIFFSIRYFKRIFFGYS